MRKVAFYTLGCKVNQSEVDSFQRLFAQAGYTKVGFDTPADVYVIHTCTVTHLSDRKCRQAVRRAVRANREAVVAVTGCYAQVAPEEILKIPGVSLVVGTQRRRQLVELVERAASEGKPLNAVERERETFFEELPGGCPARTRALVKIQEGCNQFCTYCVVPFARGPLRSREPEKVETEVEQLVKEGYLEVVLTGVHLGLYGKDLPGKANLTSLLGRLVLVPGLRRLRLSSLEPTDFTSELVEIVTTSPVICPHLHIPLQSGDDMVLKRMGRPYNTSFYRNLVQSIREKNPTLALTTDVMVGFPGETEEAFLNTKRFVQEMAFSNLHVFKYSPRPQTAAACFPAQVSPAVKEERSKVLLVLAQALYLAYAQKFLGKTLEVLVERKRSRPAGSFWEGVTGNYLRVVFPAEGENLAGKLVSVNLQRIGNRYVQGKLNFQKK